MAPTAVTGDCDFTGGTSVVATGIITAGESQECTIINTVEIIGGTVPGAPES